MLKDNRTNEVNAVPVQLVPEILSIQEIDPNEIVDDEKVIVPPVVEETEEVEEEVVNEEVEEEVEEEVVDDDKTPKSINFQGVVSHFDQEGALDIDGFETETDPTDPSYMQEAVEYTVKKQLEKYKRQFENPVSKKYLEYIESGGDPAKFIDTYAKRNYEKLTTEVISTNEALQRKLVEEDMRADGDDEETIQDMLETYAERGVLEAQAKRAHKRGVKRQQEEKEYLQQSQQLRKQEIEAQRATIVEELKEDVSKRNEIGGFKLDKKAKEKFIDYMVTSDKNGATQLQKDAQDPEKQLVMAYLYHINFDFSTLSKEVTTNVVNDLRANLGNFTDKRTNKGTVRPKPAEKTKGVDTDVLKGWLK
jgi:hypothetical protein